MIKHDSLKTTITSKTAQVFEGFPSGSFPLWNVVTLAIFYALEGLDEHSSDSVVVCVIPQGQDLKPQQQVYETLLAGSNISICVCIFCSLRENR